MGEYRILIYDPTGNPIEEIEAIPDREWLFNKIDTMKLTMPITDTKIKLANFRIGAMIAVHSPDVLIWTGIFHLPTEWDANKFTASYYGADKYLQGRTIHDIGGEGERASVSVGWLLRQAKIGGWLPIVAANEGEIETRIGGDLGGELFSSGMTIYDALDSLAEATYSEWYLRPIEIDHRLRWELIFRRRRRSFGNPIIVANNSPAILDGKGLVISGDVITAVRVDHSTADGSEGETYQNERGRDRYGHWEEGLPYEEGSRGHQERRARESLADGLPTTRYKLKIFPQIDQRLTLSLRPGSIHTLILSNVGFQDGGKGTRDRVRLIAMGYNEMDGVVDVVLESMADANRDEWLRHERVRGEG